VATIGQLSDTNQTCVAVTMITVIEPFLVSREPFCHQLDGTGGISGEDDIKVNGVGVEHLQDSKPGLLYHDGSHTRVG